MIKKTAYEDEESRFEDRPIHKNATSEALESLGDTLIFIYNWIKLIDHNYEVRYEMYNISMKKMFQKIPTIKYKPRSQDKKLLKIMIEISSGWYMEKLLRDDHHLGYQK